ncbi:TauD/TfdA dioxygenase family protein [Actinoplanes sp. NPDC051859]|uniref:TauD/TfdA dioxygenase family protein n=1 Tax=Actinoplanes sp. NPDC051859 TaxID=3363909 RepID=UPI00379C567D
MTTTKEFEKTAIRPGFGTEFRGLTADDLTDPAVIDQVRESLATTHLVVVREAAMSPERQIALARHIGEPVPFNISRYRHATYPELMISSNVMRDGKPVGVSRVGNFWHQDSSYLPDPPAYTLLQGVLVPEGHGDTLFASAIEVLEAQPSDLSERGASAYADHRHSRRFRFRPEHVGLSLPEFRAAVDAEYPPAVHPLTPRDPDTGKRFAYGSAGYTERVLEFDANDNDRWFGAIDAYLNEPDNVYRHRWTMGDIVMWKTSIAFHSATTLPDTAERIMHRVSIRAAS